MEHKFCSKRLRDAETHRSTAESPSSQSRVERTGFTIREDEESPDPTESHKYIKILASNSPDMLQSLKWWIKTYSKPGPNTEDVVAVQPFKDLKLPEISTLQSEATMCKDDESITRVLGFVESHRLPDSPAKAKYLTLVAPNKSPPLKALSQHIFASFMWAIADYIKPIVADPLPHFEKITAPREDPLARVTSNFRELGDKLSQNPELGTEEEIWQECMVALLSKYNKLSAANYIVGNALRRADRKGYRTSSNWYAITQIHTKLFDTAFVFGARSEICIKSTVTLVEHYTFLDRASKVAEDYGQTEFIRRLKENIAFKLKKAEKNVLLELIRINKKLHVDVDELLKIADVAKVTLRQSNNEPENLFGRNKYHEVSQELFSSAGK